MKINLNDTLSRVQQGMARAQATLRSASPTAIGLLAAVPMVAMAATVPTTGDPGYELYDLFVNDLAQGPLGFVGAMALLIWGGSMIKDSYWKAGAAAVGGGVILKADALTQSFGAMVQGI
jgi:hypothetical protein